MTSQTTVLLAGGGTGGHIYPNVAIVERLTELAPQLGLHFLVSHRPGDRQTMTNLGLPFTASFVQPLPPARKPWRGLGFLLAWRRAVAQAIELLRAQRVAAVVATGGFVSGPGIVAARRLGLPRAMVNLDAVPGQANRRLHGLCTQVFSAYASDTLPGAQIIGLPLRRISIGTGPRAEARTRIGLDPARPTLLVTGATHGAESIIRAMMALLAGPVLPDRLRNWQVFHQCGGFDVADLQKRYDAAGVTARVVAHCDRIGDAWAGADLAVSRAGAGSVAEAWANATPTIFLPNPYHADGHQRANALPLVDAGGALIVTDHIDPARNAADLGARVLALVGDPDRRAAMVEAARRTRPPDGAKVVAEWIATVCG